MHPINQPGWPGKQLPLTCPLLPERQAKANKHLHTPQGLVLCTQKWLQSLEEEFFAQGDFEADLGLPITPFMDRALPGISSKQARALRAFS